MKNNLSIINNKKNTPPHKIVLCTLRDNNGATGGPGGVLYLLSQFLGNDIDGIPCEYRFNPVMSRRMGARFNRQILNLQCRLEHNTFYVAHDIQTGAILAELNKPYSLVYHNQGPIVQERLNFGINMTEDEMNYWKSRERKAFIGATTLHFPSRGASDMFFGNDYASCMSEDVTLGTPLYNTIPKENIKKVDGVEKKEDTISFFSLGTITEAKGQDSSIIFIERFLEKCGDKKVRYIVVGKGPLQELVCSKGNDLMHRYPNFEFVYFKSLLHSEVAYVHEISDVYLMLHRLSIFDFATLEAMIAKTAIILSPVGGNLDFDKMNNVIYASDDYSDAINRLSYEEIERLKVLNYEVFQRYFSPEAFAEAYRKMIRLNVGISNAHE